MMNWNSIDHDQQRRDTLLRQADRARLAATSLRARRPFRPLRSLMVWTGRRLVTLGFGMLTLSREWEYRSNTVYNGARTSAH